MKPLLHGREAVPASWQWNLTKSAIQTLVFWSIFLVVLPLLIYSLEAMVGLAEWRFAPLTILGGILFVLGGSLGLTSSCMMAIHGRGTPLPADCPRELVVVGPYRYVRNPMAIAGLTQGFAVGLMLGSPAVVIYALIGGPIWHVFVRPWEEADLEQRFGEPYRHYRQQLRCWIPTLNASLPTSQSMVAVQDSNSRNHNPAQS